MADPDIHEDVDKVIEETLGGPPHAHQVDQTLQYFILLPAVLGFLGIAFLLYKLFAKQKTKDKKKQKKKNKPTKES